MSPKILRWLKVASYLFFALSVVGAASNGSTQDQALVWSLLLLCFIVYRRLAAIERAISQRDK